MSDLNFFGVSTSMPLGTIAAAGRAQVPDGIDSSRLFRMAWSLCRAGPDEVAFFLDEGDRDDLVATQAGACFVANEDRSKVAVHTIALATGDPLDAFRRVAVLLRPEAGAPRSALERAGVDPTAIVHADAKLEQGVVIDPGAVVGAWVEIGAGTMIGANSVIGAGVRIGRGCTIDAQVDIRNTLIGDRVVVHAGARIGLSVTDVVEGRTIRTPRLGRVIVQDDVEIGANAVIERGMDRDTMIGDGARIGPLALVGRGRTIDRRCAFAAPSVS